MNREIGIGKRQAPKTRASAGFINSSFSTISPTQQEKTSTTRLNSFFGNNLLTQCLIDLIDASISKFEIAIANLVERLPSIQWDQCY